MSHSGLICVAWSSHTVYKSAVASPTVSKNMTSSSASGSHSATSTGTAAQPTQTQFSENSAQRGYTFGAIGAAGLLGLIGFVLL